LAKGQKNRVVVPGDGDPCPRCRQPMRIFEHRQIGRKQRAQPFYYRRWFRCTNEACQTTLVMPECYRVWNCNNEKRASLERWMVKQNEQRKVERETECKVETGELVLWGDKWPDEVEVLPTDGKMLRPELAEPSERPPWE
jgi:hypothetical protein